MTARINVPYGLNHAFVCSLFAAVCVIVEVHGEEPSSAPPNVANFIVTLPGGAQVDRNGLTTESPDVVEIPEDFKVPRPSQITLKAGTVLKRVDGEGWQSLKITGPEGDTKTYSAEEFSGCKLMPEIDWSNIKVTATEAPLPAAAQKLLSRLKPEDTIDTFFSKLRDTEGISEYQARRVLHQFVKDHQATLSAEDLIARHQEMRNQIESIRYSSATTYHSESESLKQMNRAEKKLHTFKMQGQKLFSSTTTIDPDSDIHRLRLHSYTPEYEIEYIDNGDLKRGSRRKFSGKPKYFPIEHIFRIAMLADPLRDLGREDIEIDTLARNQFWILNNRVERNGASVVACVTMSFRVLCFDPQKGYALVSSERLYDFDEDAQRLRKRDQQLKTLISDHEEVIPGLWLPKKVVTTWTEDGRELLRRQILYTDMKVNEEIPSSEFEDVIPKGVLVIDFTSGKAKYVPNGDPEIFAPPKRAKPLISEGFE